MKKYQPDFVGDKFLSSPSAMTIIPFTAVEAETDKAFKVDCEGDVIWLPKTSIKINYNEKKITLPDWLFKDKFPKG